jgi:excinuclease UvrABC nuclease subunit
LISTLALYYADCSEDLLGLPRGEYFPEIPTVYVMTEGDHDVIVYVGQSQNLRLRLGRHELDRAKGRRTWDKVWWFCPGIPSLPNRLTVETALIAATRPKFNKAVMLRISKGNLSEIRYRRRRHKKAG